MSELPARPGDTGRGSLAVLRQQFAPEATDEDLTYFAAVSRHLDLDPWLGHICLAQFGGVYRPTITVAGRRWIAQRTGRLRGIVGPMWCGPRAYDRDQNKLPLDWLEVWDDDDDYPYAARCFVYVAGWDHPANGTVKWSEFARWKSGKDTPELMATWGTMPSHMLGKTAESLALRRGFSEVQAALDYLGGDEDAQIMREVEAEALTIPAGSPPAAGEVRGPRRRESPPRRSSSRDADRVPDHVYDATPEARGWR